MAFLRTYIAVLAALLLPVAAAVSLSDHWTATIAAEDRPSAAGNAGFTIEQYRWPLTGFKITLYAEPAMRLTYRIPHRHSLELQQTRWLPNNRALLLQLRWYMPMGSIGRHEEAILFYDFDRVTLRTSNRFGALGGATLDNATAKKERDDLFEAVHKLELEPLKPR